MKNDEHEVDLTNDRKRCSSLGRDCLEDGKSCVDDMDVAILRGRDTIAGLEFTKIVESDAFNLGAS